MSREIPGERASSSFCGDVGEGSWASGLYFLLTSDFSTVAITAVPMLPKTAVLCSTGSRHIHDLSTTLHQHWGLVRFGLRLLVHCSFPPCLSFDFSSSSFFPFLCDLLHHPKATHQSLALLFCSVIFVSRTIDFGLYVPSQTSVLRLSWGLRKICHSLEMTMFPKSVCVCLSQGESLWPKATQKPMLL